MLTEEEKTRLYLEEAYRFEVRKQLEKQDPSTDKQIGLWKFVRL